MCLHAGVGGWQRARWQGDAGSARRPGPELVGVAYGPDVLDPVASDVEREHRHGDAVLLSHQTGLTVDRTLQERHVAGCPAGEIADIARAICSPPSIRPTAPLPR